MSLLGECEAFRGLGLPLEHFLDALLESDALTGKTWVGLLKHCAARDRSLSVHGDVYARFGVRG